jgi:hypothetical protein
MFWTIATAVFTGLCAFVTFKAVIDIVVAIVIKPPLK